jgi:hypothetical protein
MICGDCVDVKGGEEDVNARAVTTSTKNKKNAHNYASLGGHCLVFGLLPVCVDNRLFSNARKWECRFMSVS